MAPVVVLLLLVASSILIFQIRTEEYKDWTAVPGVVFKREWVRDFRVRIYDTYTVDGESYTRSEVYHRSNGTAEAGDETLIWYDPENPAHSSYHKPGAGSGSLWRIFSDGAAGRCVAGGKPQKELSGILFDMSVFCAVYG